MFEILIYFFQVTFFAWKNKLLPNNMFPTFFSFFVVKYFSGKIEDFEGVKFPRYYSEDEKKRMEKYLTTKNVKGDATAGGYSIKLYFVVN